MAVSTRERIHILQIKLLQWYAQHGRDLPWRQTRDPYHILVSEIMLHQTQVNRVIPKFQEWLKAYPTFEALATAPVEEVQQLWRPLGYNLRPLRLHQIAKFVVKEHQGNLPKKMEELLALPGIGRYTAGALLSFAFHKDAPIVDTNIRRVIQRIFGVKENPMRGVGKKRIWQLAEAMIPESKAYIFNQALIDFGALLCTAKNPRCSDCFVKKTCIWSETQRALHARDSWCTL
jgi:A/G-specific adenine glycosylase